MFKAIKLLIISLCTMLQDAITGTGHYISAYSQLGEWTKDTVTQLNNEAKLEREATLRDLAKDLNLGAPAPKAKAS